jgi:hypothetical protein
MIEQAEHNNFKGLGITPEILEVIENMKFTIPTPVQSKAIPVAIEGKDILGIAQTDINNSDANGISSYSLSSGDNLYSSLSHFGGSGGGAGPDNSPNSTVLSHVGANGSLSLGAFSTGAFIRFSTGGNAAANERARIDANGNLGIGTTAPTALLSVNGNSLLSGYATVAASLNVGGGNAVAGVGTINASGGYYIAGVAGVTQATASCVTTIGGIVTGTATCPVDDTVSPFAVANGAIFTRNTTEDLLIGGTGTSSAKFAFINVNSGTPTASINGTLALNGNGTIGVTNRSQLTLGTSTTGDVLLAPGGTTALTAKPSGNIGIGTTAPTQVLDVTGNIRASGNYVSGASTGVSSSNACVTTVGGIVTAVATGCATTSPFQEVASNGTIIQNNTTEDLLLGGTSSTSAKFAFINTLAGNPTFKVFSSDSSQNVSIYHDGSNGFITSSTGILNLGTLGGSVFIESDIVNDTTSNNGAVSIADKLLVSHSEPAGTALAVFNNTGTGDIFTASASGTTRFTITNDGSINVSNYATIGASLAVGNVSAPTGNGIINVSGNYQVRGTNGITQAVASCVTSIGGLVTGTGSCPATGTTSPFQEITSAGTIIENNTTEDFLIGGVATSSAKFAVLNVLTGTTTASLSATTRWQKCGKRKWHQKITSRNL